MNKVLILPGDGIGPEVTAAAEVVLQALIKTSGFSLQLEYGMLGGQSIDAHGVPLTDDCLSRAKDSHGILLGAVGGPKWDGIERQFRPERGLLKLRQELDLFSNLRPAILFPQLAAASSLHAKLVAGLDLMIVRELTGGIYFGEPRGIEINAAGERRGFNTLAYTESEIIRIAHSAFRTAMARDKRLLSVDKANVLEVSELWREVMETVSAEYPEVQLSHMYVDNAAMQLIRAPKQFDVMVTTNMFGDILSDAASMLTGSIGMLPSASLNADSQGMYEPIHGSAPDIAGEDKANPLAMILSISMMLRYTFNENALASLVESAVSKVLDDGLRTADINDDSGKLVGTAEMGKAVANALLTNG